MHLVYFESQPENKEFLSLINNVTHRQSAGGRHERQGRAGLRECRIFFIKKTTGTRVVAKGDRREVGFQDGGYFSKYFTIFMWQFLFVRVDEENCPIFMWQIHLMKSWRVSFYVTNKSCHTRKIARVYYSSFKMWQIIAIIGGPQPPTGCSTR